MHDTPRGTFCWERGGGVEIAVLRDEASGAEARVAPGLGGACLAFRLNVGYLVSGQTLWIEALELPRAEDAPRVTAL